ncbi:gp082 (endogenous virus) [Lactococcus phage KSY1]|uniref:Gp082 n=1 Tax=Lactococcus phage KSY1 TaxID=2913972 RepID=A6MAE7_9CAUD|nr:gp082 [Lactococcus phage KSY1]ABG21625.1 gp082 [Lactococcus phage KSY1]
MIAVFEDWRSDSEYLYISKYGLDTLNRVFIELSSQKSMAIPFTSNNIILWLIDEVDILCIRAGGRYLNLQARTLLHDYKL